MSLRSRNAPSASIAESTSAPSQVSPRISRTSAPVSSARPSIQTVPTRKRKHGSNAGVTSTLISQLAVVALKRRLAQQTAVNCNVSGSSSDLLMRGEVGPVTVAGRRWRSPLGLTCRAIEAKVQTCQLDMGAVISRRKLILTVPAKGDAMIAMDDADFMGFITHPLMKPPAPPSTINAELITFVSEDVEIDAATGAITFYGLYMGERWRCQLKRGSGNGKGASIIVTHAPSRGVQSQKDNNKFALMEPELTSTMTDFFNEMVFELDGTFLSFRDMMVTQRSEVPIVMLSLDIVVKKFPSPGLAF
uniref:Uncharacterized protein n=1 Tax=Ditylum brightwellii TaxID=49249 RepID=A0A7S2EGA5_9STRA